MCARRFLIIIFILILLAIAGAFAIFQFGQDVLIRQATPSGHFVAPREEGPDYSGTENWISRPGAANDPSGWLPALPDGSRVPSLSRGQQAAAFYVHPTTYLHGDRWNAPLQNVGESGFRTSLFVQKQASTLTDAASVWAPEYRQAAYGAFLLKTEDARKALDLAYRDVSRAFDRFLQTVPERQPIILMGHSQGALHLLRLLSERKSQLKGRLVAAYIVGWPISSTADLPALGFPACSQPSQTGCILSWMTFGVPANPDMILDDWLAVPGMTGSQRTRSDIVCVNPITGTSGGAAAPSRNPGTLVPTTDFSDATLVPGLVGAHCEDGLLLLDGDRPKVGPFVLPGNNYHVYDVALFWGAVRADADRRRAAWFSYLLGAR